MYIIKLIASASIGMLAVWMLSYSYDHEQDFVRRAKVRLGKGQASWHVIKACLKWFRAISAISGLVFLSYCIHLIINHQP